ncbi:hypothetical protein [Filomicrobium sp.]|uniref:hypothetical protein n=1 Tax=Filomicrobium sp. TaxID=2024831 RepID=UPI002588AF66|nr:hypothetical protein [Filomicrobium sp.]MCV0371065.1 hypothetical protein [Filomicrobium sp.]
MLTALISALTGLVSGIVPDVLKEVRDSRDHVREMDLIRLQHDLQMARLQAEAGSKLEAAETGIVAEEIRAFRESLTAIVETQGRPTGIAWVDGLNAVLRPLTAGVLIVLLVFVALGFSSVIDHAAFSALFIEAVQAVLGFLFGYRSSRKCPTPAAR